MNKAQLVTYALQNLIEQIPEPFYKTKNVAQFGINGWFMV